MSPKAVLLPGRKLQLRFARNSRLCAGTATHPTKGATPEHEGKPKPGMQLLQQTPWYIHSDVMSTEPAKHRQQETKNELRIHSLCRPRTIPNTITTTGVPLNRNSRNAPSGLGFCPKNAEQNTLTLKSVVQM
jgi:hypothetical protein